MTAKPEFGIFRYEEHYLAVESVYIREVVPYGNIVATFGMEQDILGSMNIRGTFIPIIDLGNQLFHTRQIQAPEAVLIITNKDRCFGVAVSEVVNLATDNDIEISEFQRKNPSFSLGILFETEHQINATIINIPWLFAHTNIPTSPSIISNPSVENRINDFSTSYFIIQCGTQHLAIESEQVFATTQIRKLHKPTVQSPVVVGEIEYLGKRVPAVDLHALIFGQSAFSPESNILVSTMIVESEDKKLVAYLVDSILDINSIPSERFLPCPQDDFSGKLWLSSMANVEMSDRKMCLLLEANIHKLRYDDIIINISKVCRDSEEGDSHTTQTLNQLGASQSALDPSHMKESLLMFKRDGILAVKLSDVIEIKMRDIPIIPLPTDPNILGIFEYNGQSIMLYDLHQLLEDGIPCRDINDNLGYATQRILIIQCAEQKKAFIVDKLIDIQEASYIPSQKQSHDSPTPSDKKLIHYLIESKKKNYYIKCLNAGVL